MDNIETRWRAFKPVLAAVYTFNLEYGRLDYEKFKNEIVVLYKISTSCSDNETKNIELRTAEYINSTFK